MSLAINSDCIRCQVSRNIALAEKYSREPQITEFARRMLALLVQLPEDAASPLLSAQIEDLLRQMFDVGPDRYLAEKERSNRFALERLEEIRRRVRSSPDPCYAALQFAVLGNYIDFSALQGNVRFEQLDEMLSQAANMALDKDCYASLRRSLADAKTLLYVTDNAGEIVFDRVCAETLREAYPDLSITFLVRGGPSLNDATRGDAQAVGIPFPVIDNGNQIPGTHLPALGPEAKQAFEQADVILSKGLGNLETLSGCGYPIYYAFLIKCQRFVNLFDKPLMTPMLTKEL